MSSNRFCDDRRVFRKSARIYDAVYASKDYPAEAARVHALIQERLPGASSLLDVACGTGKHLEQFRRWYEVAGLDLDERLIEIARERLGGVPLHVADMTTFDLGSRFDAVTCLFSAIGYARTVEGLTRAVATMARHLTPNGVLVLEPWLAPDAWVVGRPHLLTVDQHDLKIARMTISGREGRLAIIDFTYLVGTTAGVEQFSERHEMALFSDNEYRDAFTAAELAVEHDEDGLIGRGLYLGQPAR